MRWTTQKLAYLRDNAGDGARAISEALGCSVDSVKAQARRCGISLKRRWRCPKCGMTTFKPLNRVTGWCSNCTKEAHNEELAEQVRELESEVRREERNDRERQRLYSRKHRAKKKRNL